MLHQLSQLLIERSLTLASLKLTGSFLEFIMLALLNVF